MRKVRSDKGQIRYDDRDVIALRWVAEQYAVRLDSLGRLLGRTAQGPTKIEGQLQDSGVNRVLRRWLQDEVAATRKLYVRQPGWVWITPSGLRQLELPFKAWRPTIGGRLNHLHHVNEVRLRIEAQFSDGRWHPERALRREHSGDERFHIPDGEFYFGGYSYGIEVELTAKSAERARRLAFQVTEQYDRVWYFVNDQTRPVIEEATKQLVDRIQIYDIAAVVKAETESNA